VKSVFTEEYETVLQQLIIARKKAAITQHELALKLAKPQSFVSKYERRERRLDVVELVLIARALEFDPCLIIRGIEARLSSRSTGN
jgi:transcriptional regulator with XRE-family HTH domain